jgi:AcrR family transcriptional regulator
VRHSNDGLVATTGTQTWTQTIWSQPPPPPRQRTLGRDEIVAAAIALADDQGAAALTMKAVAARLGPYSAMSLYRYVHSKEGLVDLMLDSAASEIPLPDQKSEDWRTTLRELALASWQLLGHHPWYAELAHTRPPGPHAMRRLDFMLVALTDGGATLPDAMTYAALLDRHILGSGIQQAEETRTRSRQHLTDDAAFVAALTAQRDLAAASGAPLLARWLAHPSGPTPDAQFELGLDFLLDGIASRLAA